MGTTTMFEASSSIPDLNRLIAGLKSSDPISGQNALGALCVAACQSTNSRDLLAKRCDAILAPLVVHLMSDINGLIHNASLCWATFCTVPSLGELSRALP